MDPLLKMTEQNQNFLIEVLFDSCFYGAGVAFLAISMLNSYKKRCFYKEGRTVRYQKVL